MSEHTYADGLESNSSMYDGSRKLDVGNVSCTEFVIHITNVSMYNVHNRINQERLACISAPAAILLHLLLSDLLNDSRLA